ncbi:MAG: acyl carrier protein [Cyclobacteriaceae bacterium]
MLKDIQKKISEVLVEKVGIQESEITPDANILLDFGIDSIDYAELVIEFEQVFDITISCHEADQIKTISDAVRYIDSKLSVSL